MDKPNRRARAKLNHHPIERERKAGRSSQSLTLANENPRETKREKQKGQRASHSSPRAEWMGIYFRRTSPPVVQGHQKHCFSLWITKVVRCLENEPHTSSGPGHSCFLPQPSARQPEVPSPQPCLPTFPLPHKLPLGQFWLSTSQTAWCLLPLESLQLVDISHRKSQLSLSCPDCSLTLASKAPGDLEPCLTFYPPIISPWWLR